MFPLNDGQGRKALSEVIGRYCIYLSTSLTFLAQKDWKNYINFDFFIRETVEQPPKGYIPKI